jgi:hypothetical protein
MQGVWSVLGVYGVYGVVLIRSGTVKVGPADTCPTIPANMLDGLKVWWYGICRQWSKDLVCFLPVV